MMRYTLLLVILITTASCSREVMRDKRVWDGNHPRLWTADDIKKELNITQDEYRHALGNIGIDPVGERIAREEWNGNCRCIDLEGIYNDRGFEAIKQAVNSVEGRVYRLEHPKK